MKNQKYRLAIFGKDRRRNFVLASISPIEPSFALAIDPKGLCGERVFDYANLICNPDYEIASAPGRFAQRVDVVAKAANLDHQRLIQWILAWAGLSASFLLDDGFAPDAALKTAKMAAAEQG